MSQLVYIGRVTQVFEIPDAERIESLEVVCGHGGKWRCTALKGQFVPGTLCQVYLPDSLLPQTPEFAFMEKHRYRVRMARFLGVPSEALVMPQVIPGEVGTDVTREAGVTRYEKALPVHVAGSIAGHFPSFVPRTEEPHFQRVSEMVQALYGKPFYSTVKADGSSGTVYRHQGRFGVCSRNHELKDTPNNAFWKCVRDYGVEELLPEGMALQFEAVGPGIQKNPMGLRVVEPRFFNLWDVGKREYASCDRFMKFCADHRLPTVQLIEAGWPFVFDDDELRRHAMRQYPNGKQAEGVVIRPMEEEWVGADRLSFKVINLLYDQGR